MNIKKVISAFLSCVIFPIETASQKDIEITAEKVSETDTTATMRCDTESSDEVFCDAIK